MAVVITDGKFPKRIGNYVLYRLDDQVIIRPISGFTSKGMKHAEKYELSRQNANEFGRVSALCKQIRLTLYGILPRYNNLDIVNHFTKKMRAVMAHDTSNARGQRHLAAALATSGGRELLTGYEFNPDTHFRYTVNQQENGLHIVFTDLKGITGCRLHQLAFNFENGESQLAARGWQLHTKPSLAGGVALDLPVPPVEGTVFAILEVARFTKGDGCMVETEKGKSVRIVVVTGIGLAAKTKA